MNCIRLPFFCIGFFILLTAHLHAQSYFSAADERIQYFGRWDFTNPARPAHSWPGVCIYAEFEGTRIGIRLNDNFNYFNVYIDGTFSQVFHGTSAETADYTLASGLTEGQHTLLLTKRNENHWTYHTFNGILLDEGKSLLEPAERPLRKMEFIGDSFTSASGNEAPTSEAPSDVEKYTNIDEGFGPIIARHYGAQYHMTSVSGIGMVLDWQGDYSNNLPDRFNRTIIPNEEPVWEFEQWIPHLVVIGLGLNDYSGFGGWEGTLIPSETDLYKTRYHEFISTIRDVYPGVKILAVATHVEWMRTTIAEIVDEENDKGNMDVFYARYSYYDGGYVNNGHPNVETHHGIADELTAYIDTMDPWEPYVDTTPPEIISLPESPFVSYDTDFGIEVVTDSYSTVRYDFTDKPYDDMAHGFTVTGRRNHTLIFSGQHGSEYTLYLRASDVSGNQTPVSSIISFSIDTSRVLLNWYDPGYIDTEWNQGPARFGQEGDPATVTSVNDVHTVYFRKAVAIENPEEITAFGILVKGSDAAVVYLNGIEIGRVNFLEGVEISYDTPALKSSVLNRMFVVNDPAMVSLLKPGENVIAVEMHTSEEGSSGISFDAQMITQNNQVIFTLGSEWKFYDAGNQPESQIIDKTTEISESGSAPVEFRLFRNYPNPFNPSTMLAYTVPRTTMVEIEVYNLTGQRIASLVNKIHAAGEYWVHWDGSGHASGVYVVRIKTDSYIQSKKMLLVR